MLLKDDHYKEVTALNDKISGLEEQMRANSSENDITLKNAFN